MPGRKRQSAVDYLAKVQRQLQGLSEREQQEVLREIGDHVEDASLRYLEQGLNHEDAVARAVADMGDPTPVGRRIRDEHLARGLPLKEDLLAAAPVLTFVVPMFLSVLGEVFLPRETLQAWSPLTLPGVLVVPALCGWSLSRGHSRWLPAYVGYGAALGTAAVALLFYSYLPAGGLTQLLVALALCLPLLAAASLFRRWGSPGASLAVLAGLAFVVHLAWIIPEGPDLFTFPSMLAPFFGLVAVATAPRRRQLLVSWLVFVAFWLLIAGVAVYDYYYWSTWGVAYAGPAYGPLTLGLVWEAFPLPLFVASAFVLLLAQSLPGQAGRWRNGRPHPQLRVD